MRVSWDGLTKSLWANDDIKCGVAALVAFLPTFFLHTELSPLIGSLFLVLSLLLPKQSTHFDIFVLVAVASTVFSAMDVIGNLQYNALLGFTWVGWRIVKKDIFVPKFEFIALSLYVIVAILVIAMTCDYGRFNTPPMMAKNDMMWLGGGFLVLFVLVFGVTGASGEIRSLCIAYAISLFFFLEYSGGHFVHKTTKGEIACCAVMLLLATPTRVSIGVACSITCLMLTLNSVTALAGICACWGLFLCWNTCMSLKYKAIPIILLLGLVLALNYYDILHALGRSPTWTSRTLFWDITTEWILAYPLGFGPSFGHEVLAQIVDNEILCPIGSPHSAWFYQAITFGLPAVVLWSVVWLIFPLFGEYSWRSKAILVAGSSLPMLAGEGLGALEFIPPAILAWLAFCLAKKEKPRQCPHIPHESITNNT